MTVIPLSMLAPSDVHLLGNNVLPRRRRSPLSLAAVNRSLAIHDACVERLVFRKDLPQRPGRPRLIH